MTDDIARAQAEAEVLELLRKIQKDIADKQYDRVGQYGLNTFLCWRDPEIVGMYVEGQLNDNVLNTVDYIAKGEPIGFEHQDDDSKVILDVTVILKEPSHGDTARVEFKKVKGTWRVWDINSQEGYGRLIDESKGPVPEMVALVDKAMAKITEKIAARMGSAAPPPKTPEQTAQDELEIRALIRQFQQCIAAGDYERVGTFGESTVLSFDDSGAIRDYFNSKFRTDTISEADYIAQGRPTYFDYWGDIVTVTLTEPWHKTIAQLKLKHADDRWVVLDIYGMLGEGLEKRKYD